MDGFGQNKGSPLAAVRQQNVPRFTLITTNPIMTRRDRKRPARAAAADDVQDDDPDDDEMPPLVDQPAPPASGSQPPHYAGQQQLTLTPQPSIVFAYSPTLLVPSGPSTSSPTSAGPHMQSPPVSPHLLEDEEHTIAYEEPSASNTRRRRAGSGARGGREPRSSHARKHDESYIPRPPNAFILFRSSFIHSQKISGKVEGNNSQLSKIIGTCFVLLPRSPPSCLPRAIRVSPSLLSLH